jgi:hypothetical protein
MLLKIFSSLIIFMGKPRILPMSRQLYEEAHRQIVKTLKEIMSREKDILVVGVYGPFLPENTEEWEDKLLGYCCGSPCAQVTVGLNSDIYKEHIDSLTGKTKIQRIKEELHHLEETMGITILTTPVSLKEPPLGPRKGGLMNVEKAVEYMFGPLKDEFTIVYSGRQGYNL